MRRNPFKQGTCDGEGKFCFLARGARMRANILLQMHKTASNDLPDSLRREKTVSVFEKTVSAFAKTVSVFVKTLTVFPQVALHRVPTNSRFRAGSAWFSGESPKSVGINPCLSGFQTGRIHEEVSGER